MFGSDILNVFIGLAFIFFLFSLLSSWIQEAFAALTKKRAKHLFKIISTMLNPGDPNADAKNQTEKLLKDFYKHPVIKGLAKPGKEAEKPELKHSYIAAGEFSMALIDLLYQWGREKDDEGEEKKEAKKDDKAKKATAAQAADTEELDLAVIKKGVSRIKNDTLRKALQLLITTSETKDANLAKKVNAVRKNLEAWFNSMMDRATEWYKRNIQIIAMIVGIGLAGFFNVDSIALVKAFWQEAALREAVTKTAIAYVEKEIAVQPGQDPIPYKDVIAQINELGIPIGWDIQKITDVAAKDQFGWWFFKILGILITGFAISQGSSFWYDLLKRIVNMRIAGPKPEEKAGKGKEQVVVSMPAEG